MKWVLKIASNHFLSHFLKQISIQFHSVLREVQPDVESSIYQSSDAQWVEILHRTPPHWHDGLNKDFKKFQLSSRNTLYF